MTADYVLWKSVYNLDPFGVHSAGLVMLGQVLRLSTITECITLLLMSGLHLPYYRYIILL